MKPEINRNEWIEAYLNGELPADEVAKVKELIAKDVTFAKEVESVKELHEIIIDSSLIDIKKELSGIHQQGIRNNWIKKITEYGSGAIVISLVIIYILNYKPGKRDVNTLAISDTTVTIVNNPLHDKISKDTKQIVNSKENKPTQLAKNEKVFTNETKKTIENKAIAHDTIVHPNIKSEKEIQPSDITNISEKSQVPKVMNCSKVKIKVGYTTEESCNDAATGNITIIKESVKGGKMPYLFSLNKTDFSDSVTFRNLTSNIYSIYIKDANNCVVKAASILVGRKDCSVVYQEIFAPFYGETWKIPVKQGGEGVIQIFSKNGSMVYTAKVSANDANIWNGENMSRQILPMGLYQFIIKYKDGEVFSGEVTIAK